MRTPFTDEAEKAISKAEKFSVKLGNTIFGTEHLLYGIAAVSGVAGKILKENSITKDGLEFEIENYCGNGQTVLEEKIDCSISPRVEEVWLASDEDARKYGSETVGTEHMLLAILKNTDSTAYKILLNMGANIQKIYMDIIMTIGADPSTAKSELIASRSRGRKNGSKAPTLDQYARNLNELAKKGKIDPVINREDEISSVIEILSRRTKNNPCLIGEPGVGKTAIIEGLASRIEEGLVPRSLEGKRVMTLDLSGLVAGTKYRGEFEERIKRSIKEVENAGDILLFIDELHTVIGAGGAEGSLDASNILKPSLARGDIQVIGATTREEYRKHIEKDAALERRFQPVVVEEPTPSQTIGMLKGLKDKYEDFHKINISDEAINAAVTMSVRYVNDRFLPDKAIDLIDEASARFRLQKILKKGDTSKKYENEIEELSVEREDALIKGDIELAKSINENITVLRSKIEKEKKKANKKPAKASNTLKEEHIAQIVAKWTHIPVSKLEATETEKLKKLDDILHKRVVGQDEAVEAVARAVRRGRAGLKDPKRPIGSFLFLGPTGVGKTELSKALAEAVFGSEKNMIRIDMSEYMEKASVSKMIGSPPGYVGYEEGGQLSEKVRQKPYSVLLFDEIEKAHPDVFNMLLQVLEDGHLTDSQGRKVDFKNTIIIMTSNAGANRIISPKALGFGQEMTEEESFKKMQQGVMEEVKRIFKPEFLNRVDERIVFRALTKENIDDITKIMMDVFIKRAKEQMDLTLKVDKEVVSFVAKKGFDKDYGARPIRRALQSEIEDLLAEGIINGEISMGDKVVLSMEDSNKIHKKVIAK